MNTLPNTAPVALFVYNRPDHTRRALEALSGNGLAEHTDLHVFSDAPRMPGHAPAVAAVRSLFKDSRGFRSLTVIERERNLGLAASITSGVHQLCAEYGRVIVLEDDLVVAPGFLAFMNRALEHYQAEPRVMQISGYMYPGDFGGIDDTLFLPMISCWGWGTWKRAWDHYDSEMGGYDRLMADKTARARFDLNGAYDYSGMLQRQRDGELDSWGIRWHLTVFQMEGLVLYPARSLIINAGVDGSGTHGAGTAELQQSQLIGVAADGPAAFPRALAPDERALEQIEANLRRLKPGVISRLVKRLAQ